LFERFTPTVGHSENQDCLIEGFHGPQTVAWSIVEGNVHTQTRISTEGVLMVAANETLNTFTVRATLINDSTMYGDAVVTVFRAVRDGNGNVIVPRDTLAEQLEWLRISAASNERYIVSISADQTIAHWSGVLPFGRTGLSIILRGEGEPREVRLLSGGTLFTVPSGVTFVLDNNVTLVGSADNVDNLVVVYSGGTFIMNEGSRATDNLQYPWGRALGWGAGVRVNYGGLFILNGGTIHGNRTAHVMPEIANERQHGGGVSVGGRFYMLSGTISGNSAITYGGGVYIGGSGVFRMTGGVIYGNVAPAGLANTARDGAALSITSLSVNQQRGTFANKFDGFTAASLGAWTATGNFTIVVNSTIRLYNGQPVP